ncbi:FAD-dependent monooxygenase [Dyadobacter sp. LHD-138]|uniref:FAD-dependent monooxygenase n=1 Tax=Dyadobacter sp. LHD-138 TaxID=3071413 RepID=UPI0027E13A1F|nr:FAD-dependent monooxygenase [Dyadobacter sp. LHD-138]MDQ6481099.1 FAD-dependent monooxygenase [Dyadobacter sp. LHD-138]
MKNDISVLIAGGGPAGIATALSLLNRGIKCMIAEPGMPATHKVGETIPPNAKPMLIRSGIDQLLADPEHLPCYGNSFIWGSDVADETSFIRQTYQQGWHINRIFFEKQLRAHVLSNGVIWLQGQRVTYCRKQEVGWEVILQDGDNTKSVLCDFLVDATGRSCRIARFLGLQRTRMDTLTGISAMIATAESIQPHHTYIEATADGWWYAAPLSDKKLSLVFMTDADLMDQQMRQTDYFQKNAAKTALIGPLLKGDICEENIQTALHPASTSLLTRRFGDSWLAVGDAAHAFDPLSSYGIVSALEGGYYAGHAIADALSDEEDALPAYDGIISQAFQIYLKMHAQQYQLEKRWEDSTFWQRRRQGY